MFFDICGINKMFNVIMENYISLLVGLITIFGIVLASFQFLCDHQKNDQRSNFYLGYNIFELELKDNVTILSLVTRPPKVRPKKSNFGGRYFYVKIQL